MEMSSSEQAQVPLPPARSEPTVLDFEEYWCLRPERNWPSAPFPCLPHQHFLMFEEHHRTIELETSSQTEICNHLSALGMNHAANDGFLSTILDFE